MNDPVSSLRFGPVSPAVPGALYQQIVDAVRREVSEGRLKPGDELPSFRKLAEDLVVSVITVKRAYEELERAGILYRRQGLGTFVAERAEDRNREAVLATARERIAGGLRAAAEAGLSHEELRALLDDALNRTITTGGATSPSSPL